MKFIHSTRLHLDVISEIDISLKRELIDEIESTKKKVSRIRTIPLTEATDHSIPPSSTFPELSFFDTLSSSFSHDLLLGSVTSMLNDEM